MNTRQALMIGWCPNLKCYKGRQTKKKHKTEDIPEATENKASVNRGDAEELRIKGKDKDRKWKNKW